MNTAAGLKDRLHYKETFNCVQCGYCLPVCPTYETMKSEVHSPRGRINLVKMLAEDKIKAEDLREPIEKCLGCRACETACPTSVQYGKILEGAKEVLENAEQKSRTQKISESLIFDQIFPSKRWMNTIGNLSWFYQKSGMQKMAQRTGITQFAPLHLGKFETVLPNLPSPWSRQNRASVFEASGSRKVTVGFITGCVMDAIFYETNRNTIDLLTKAGADVLIPQNQTCCGALHAHAGKIKDAKSLAKRNIEAFEKEKVDFIVNNAGGCGATLLEYGELFKGDEEWETRAKNFSSKIRDISQVLTELDSLSFTKEVNGMITFQPSCHMINVQKVKEEPISLLKQVKSRGYREMKDKERCCGSAGIYNIVNYDDSMEILDSKMKNAKNTNASIIVTSNPGCLLQMKLGIQREGLEKSVRAVHLVDLLVEAGAVSKSLFY
ncbi:glycolate oxidase [Sporosarcina globispora]|uniref:Glycolate oxidase iron-sulfur subunit n=1 Tax=Sporosarcina globispora TaxID=1459 RepID=A0A0M0GDT1_SPOGL|nr:(Fe-S)-binding protein [Sporosarcina globispora]KON87933.1 glycolate oxidase [Sporosarcina globispora]